MAVVISFLSSCCTFSEFWKIKHVICFENSSVKITGLTSWWNGVIYMQNLQIWKQVAFKSTRCSALLDVRHCPKLQSCAISRKTFFMGFASASS